MKKNQYLMGTKNSPTFWHLEIDKNLRKNDVTGIFLKNEILIIYQGGIKSQ